MATPTTVMEFRANEKAARDLGVLDLQSALLTTNDTLTTLRAEVAGATDGLAALQAAEATLRLAIAVATMPAEAAALVVVLETNLMDQRVARAVLAAKQDELARAEQDRARTGARLDLERARQIQADADLKIAQATADETARWKLALSAPELTAAIADAKKAATTTLVNSGRTKLENLLGGADFQELLHQRYVDGTSAGAEPAADAGRLIDALGQLSTSRCAVDGEVSQAATAFGRVRAEVRDTGEMAVQQHTWAKATLTATANAPALPAEDKATIDARAATAKPAAVAETAVHAALALERVKLADLDAVALPQEAADPDFDRSTLGAPFTAWDDARGARETAEAAFTDAMKAELDRWEVSVPPLLMAAAVDYLRAVAVIDRLKATNTGTLDADLTAAEAAYAAALDARATSDRLLQAAGQRVAARLDDAATAAKVDSLRLAALVRGDA